MLPNICEYRNTAPLEIGTLRDFRYLSGVLGCTYSPKDKQNLLCMNFPFGAELCIISR